MVLPFVVVCRSALDKPLDVKPNLLIWYQRASEVAEEEKHI